MAKINGGYSAMSWGPKNDTTPHEDGSIPQMSNSIPSHTAETGTIGDAFDNPYQKMIAYGEEPPVHGDQVAEDAHPITPFHDVLRNEGFKHAGRQHTESGSIGHYKKENPSGGHEQVELHHDRSSGKVSSVTKSGGEGNSLSHSHNSSPEKMHRNIHEASYRAPKNMPAAHTAGQIRANRGFLKGTGSTGGSTGGSTEAKEA